MKVLQFAFDPASDSEYLPHRYPENCVAYPGTHDNTTLADWLRHGPAKERRKAIAYLGLNREEGYVDGMLRGVLASPAKLAVIPMADWLGLGAAGRINTPSTLGGNNWRWRLKADQLTPDLAKKIRGKNHFVWQSVKKKDLSKAERSFCLTEKREFARLS